jgi:hypothetical protein
MFGQLSTTASRIVWVSWVVGFSVFAGLLSFEAYRAAMSKHWPVTDGIVISFYEVPNYRYSVRGGTYVGTHASCNEFFDRFSSIKNSAKYAVRYPLNGKVTVHYLPDDPEVAVLETEFDRSIIKVIGVFLLCALVGVVGFWRGWRWRTVGRARV